MRNPLSREPGFFLTMLPNMVSMMGAVYCTFMYNETPLIGYVAGLSYVYIALLNITTLTYS